MNKDRKYYSERSFEYYDILKELFMSGSISSDDVLYFPENYNFSYDDFIETWNFLFSLDKREDKSSPIKDMYFEEERCYFQLLDGHSIGQRFILNSIHDQGSIYQFLVPFDEIPFVEECKIILNFTKLKEEFPIWIESEIIESERMEKFIHEWFESEDGKKFVQKMKELKNVSSGNS